MPDLAAPEPCETDNWRILVSTCRDLCPHHRVSIPFRPRMCDLLDNKSGRCELQSCPLRFKDELARLAKIG